MSQRPATTPAPTRSATSIPRAPAPDSSGTVQVAGVRAPANREQAIREAAYALFQARGCEPGHDLDDWLQAEAQVQQADGKSASDDSTGRVAH
jgi:Protein of unknown function (DUF2934)